MRSMQAPKLNLRSGITICVVIFAITTETVTGLLVPRQTTCPFTKKCNTPSVTICTDTYAVAYKYCCDKFDEYGICSNNLQTLGPVDCKENCPNFQNCVKSAGTDLVNCVSKKVIPP